MVPHGAVSAKIHIISGDAKGVCATTEREPASADNLEEE